MPIQEVLYGGGAGGIVGGVSTGGNTAGDTQTVSSQLVFVGGANITLSEATAAGGAATVSIIGGAGGAGFQGGVSTGGNTLGNTKTVANLNVFAGINNITLSQSTNAGGATITISGPSAQTGISGISATDTLYASGTVRLTGSNMVTVKSSGAGQTIIFDATQSVQTQNSVLVNGSSGAMSLDASRNVTASNNANTVMFYGPANILNSFSVSGNTATTNSSAVTGGGWVLAGGQNITLNQSNNTISISAAAGGAGYTAGNSNIGNTVGDTGVVTGRLVLVGDNNVTLSGSTNAGSMTISISGPNGGGAGASSMGNTAGTTGTVGIQLALVGSNNITLSQSINGSSGTLSIIGAAGGAFTGGVSSGGNTAGTTGTVASGILFVGGTNVTLTQSSAANAATITIGGADQRFSAGVSTGGNTAGDTKTVSNQLVLVGSNNITLSQATDASGKATVSIIGAAGGAAATAYHYPPMGLGALAIFADAQGANSGSSSANGASTHSTMSYYVQPMAFDMPVAASNIMNVIKLTLGTGATYSYTVREYLGLYTLTSDSISLASSWLGGLCHSVNNDSISMLGFTGSGLNSLVSGTTVSAGLSLVSGTKLGVLAQGAMTTFPASQYFAVYGQFMVSGGAGAGLGYQQIYKTLSMNQVGLVTASTSIWWPLNGAFSSTSSTNVADSNQWLMPSAVATSNITCAAGGYNQQLRPQFYFRGL